MGLFGSEKNLAAQLTEAQARVAELEGQLNDARAACEDATKARQEIESAGAKLAEELSAAKSAAQAAAAAQEAAEIRATLAEAAEKELAAKLANPGEAYQDASKGREKALAEGSADAGDSISTWEQALAACGGSYTGARRKFPAAYAAFMAQHARQD